MAKRRTSIFCICVLLFSAFGFTGCIPIPKPGERKETKQEIEEESKKETETEEDDNVIVAGSIDTSSPYSFSVEETIVGLNDYDEPVVVLVGSFTNHSDEDVSFSSALEAKAMQSGYTLPREYVPGSSDLNNNDIASETTISVILAWRLADAEDDITLTVIDRWHYAREEIYSQTFTIEELIYNTENYQDADDIIEKTL